MSNYILENSSLKYSNLIWKLSSSQVLQECRPSLDLLNWLMTNLSQSLLFRICFPVCSLVSPLVCASRRAPHICPNSANVFTCCTRTGILYALHLLHVHRRVRRLGRGVPNAVGQGGGETRRAHQGVPVVPRWGAHASAADAHPAAHHEHDDQRARLAWHPLVRAHRHARHDLLHEHHHLRHSTRYATTLNCLSTHLLPFWTNFWNYFWTYFWKYEYVWWSSKRRLYALSICTVVFHMSRRQFNLLLRYTSRPPMCCCFACAGIVLVLTIHPGNPSQTLNKYGSTAKSAGAVATTMDLIRCALALSVRLGSTSHLLAHRIPHLPYYNTLRVYLLAVHQWLIGITPCDKSHTLN